MRLRYLLLLLVPLAASADDQRERHATSPTSVVEDSMCIPDLTGQACLHVDEDVAGLVIEVIGSDGVTIATYDDATEIEDISVIGTYAAPSANNVRVSPQGNSGADLTQMMFADTIYASESWITITVSDGQTTIMDFKRTVYLDNPVDVGKINNCTIAGDGTTTPFNVSGCP